MEEIRDRTACVCGDKSLLDDRDFLAGLLEKMLIVRKFEEKVQEFFEKGLLYGTAHLGIGEEATGAGTGAALKDGDYVLATHRGHGQAIGKGCDVNRMMAEILGRSGGLCGGRGGSMHMSDIDRGVLCANGIVGANAPLACGAALTIKQKGIKDRVSVSFFGDGASNTGAVHEAMNMASAWKLPVIFCLVNNGYAMSMPLDRAVGDTDLAKRAAAYGMKALECDGNDVLAVYEAAKAARRHALGHGPVLLVEHTYRTSGHSKSDRNRYRAREEIEAWQAHNPIARFQNFLLGNGLFTRNDFDLAEKKAAAIIEDAAAWAMSCPEPDADGVLDGVYAGGAAL